MVKLILNKREVLGQHSTMVIYSYLVLAAVNALTIAVAHALFPTQVVLGTFTLSPAWALALAVGKLTALNILTMLLVTRAEWKRNSDFSPKEWMVTYFFVNVIGLWVIGRFAAHLGLGIAHWYVALLLGAVLDWFQGMAMMALGKYARV